MATAKKLPSGSWRVQVYDYTDENGKKHRKSFTAPTRRQAEIAAAQYLADPNRKIKEEITVKDAIDRYISAKEGVLSPSTVRGYKQMQKTYYSSIEGKDIFKLTSEDMQKFVSAISLKVGAKSVANICGLLISSVVMFRPDAVFRVTMPKKVKKKKTSPTNADVQKLFNAADGELKICIALAAFGSMRRGEICALKYGDVSGCVVHVHADMVEDENNHFVYKEIPKTSDSVRSVCIPSQVAFLIGKGNPDAFIITKTPNAVTHAFTKLRDKHGMDICFHDLRHYYASIGAVLGVPDTYLSDFGGWRRGSGVMKEVYQNTMEDAKELYAGIMTEHFSNLIDGAHESAHEKKRTPKNRGLKQADNGNRTGNK